MLGAQTIADYIVASFQECGDLITNLKLQKLLYYVQGWYLGLYGKELFSEDFEAWVHGPVIPAIYNKYKDNEWHPILDKAISPHLSKKVQKHIEDVLQVYGGDTGYSLEYRTHHEFPWINARRGLPQDASSTNIISKASMEKFFKEEAVCGEKD